MWECLGDIRNNLNCCTNCSLKTLGYVIGWLGVTYRTVAVVALSVIVSRLTKYDPAIFEIIYSVTLSYSLVSLVADFALIIGIRMKKSYLLIPYISMQGFEIFVGALAIIGGSLLVAQIDMEPYIGIIIPVGLILLGLNFTLWIYLIKLYNSMDKQNESGHLFTIIE